jgi:hypothetical protein
MGGQSRGARGRREGRDGLVPVNDPGPLPHPHHRLVSMAIKNRGILDERRVDLSRRVASRDDLR